MMTNQLYLANWTVLDVIEEPDTYRISAQYDVQPEACEKCGVVGQLYRHGVKETTFVDAPVHGRHCFVDVRRAGRGEGAAKVASCSFPGRPFPWTTAS